MIYIPIITFLHAYTHTVYCIGVRNHNIGKVHIAGGTQSYQSYHLLFKNIY